MRKQILAKVKKIKGHILKCLKTKKNIKNGCHIYCQQYQRLLNQEGKATIIYGIFISTLQVISHSSPFCIYKNSVVSLRTLSKTKFIHSDARMCC